jgi:serine protease
VPANPHPAKVINMSLGGKGSCSAQIQSMINTVLDAGAFVAVAAGNDNANANAYVPASCGGVSTVGATDYFGARATYSNFSTNLDISAPGGDFTRYGLQGAIRSTWNSGKTVAGHPTSRPPTERSVDAARRRCRFTQPRSTESLPAQIRR